MRPTFDTSYDEPHVSIRRVMTRQTRIETVSSRIQHPRAASDGRSSDPDVDARARPPTMRDGGTTEERAPLAPRAVGDVDDRGSDDAEDDVDRFASSSRASRRRTMTMPTTTTTIVLAVGALLASSSAASIARRHGRDTTSTSKLRFIADTMGSPSSSSHSSWVLDDYEPRDDGDFSALRLRPPMRLTSPMSEDFIRAHAALGSPQDDDDGAVYAQEAVEVGRAIDAESRGEDPRAFDVETDPFVDADGELDPFWDAANATKKKNETPVRAKSRSKSARAARLGETAARKPQPRRALPQRKESKQTPAPMSPRARKIADEAEMCAKLQRALSMDPDFVADYGERYFTSADEDFGTGVIFGGDARRKGIKLLAHAYLFPKLNASAYARLVDWPDDEEHGDGFSPGIPKAKDGKNEKAKLGATSGGNECKIVYFYHVPRTGGGSLVGYLANSRLDVQRFERSKFAKNGTELFELQKLSDDEHWNRIVENVLRPGSHVIHHHVGRAGLLDMGERLASLRRRAEGRGCGFKSFTILREPLRRDLSEAAARPGGKGAKRDYLDEQTRFLLVNAGNEVSKSWPKFLTSENTDLPGLLESTTELLEKTFDDIYVLNDEEAVVKEMNAFFGIADGSSLATLRSSIRHVSSYAEADRASRATFARIRRAHAAAEEADWLDQKLFAWALQRSSGSLATHHAQSESSSKSLDADVLEGVE